MTGDYKQQIAARIKESINDWIGKLKEQHPESLLTKQWKLLWPKGFNPGHTVIPVVTGSKQGRHLAGEVQFLLPDSLELDYDTIQLELKDEPYKETKARKSQAPVPVPIDEPIDILNNLVLGLNEFIGGISLNITAAPTIRPTEKQQPSSSRANPSISAGPAILGAAPPLNSAEASKIDQVKEKMLKSAYLPEWFKTIKSRQVWETLLEKLAEGYLHYCARTGRQVDLEEFFGAYTDHLKESGKLQDYCKYKSQPVSLDSSGHCNESYCSKKPYHAPCSYATLKFGQQE